MRSRTLIGVAVGVLAVAVVLAGWVIMGRASRVAADRQPARMAGPPDLPGPASPFPKVVIDLLAMTGDQEAVFTVPAGQSFLVLLGNYASGSTYRLEADWDRPSDTRPQEDRFVHPRDTIKPQDPSWLRNYGWPSRCDAVRSAAVELLKATEENQVPPRVAALRALVTENACPEAQKVMLNLQRSAYFQTPHAYHFFQLATGDSLSLRVARLSPEGQVVRSWHARLVPITPAMSWPHASEEEWLVAQTVRAIIQLTDWARSKSGQTLTGEASVALAPGAGGTAPTYRISVPGSASALPDVVIDQHVWSPRSYEALASALLKEVGRPQTPPSPEASVLPALLDLRTKVLEAESERVSDWLARSPLDPKAHQQAALLLGGLALREAADQFSDNRTTLSRMAAHLAVACALGGCSVRPDGDYADALLLTLAGREKDALTKLQDLERATPTPAQMAWIGALRVRSTGDWRLLDRPEKRSLLEQLEWYRATRARVGGQRGMEFLERARPAPVTDWGRLALQGTFSVAEGHLFAGSGPGEEVAEFQEVWKTVTGSEATQDGLVAALNERPVGWVASGPGHDPRVIDRGTWARFYQRHLCHRLMATERFLAERLRLEEDATSFRRTTVAYARGLELFPFVGVAWWHLRPDGTSRLARSDDDCDAIGRLVQASPQDFTFENWAFVLETCQNLARQKILPPLDQWFSPWLPTGTAFEAAERLSALRSPRNRVPALLETLRSLAPHQGVVLSLSAEAGPANRSTAALEALFGGVLAYDLGLMRFMAGREAADPLAYQRRYERILALNPDAAFELGEYLADRNLDEGALRAYELGWANARDRVLASHQCGWLVDYYLDHGSLHKALAVAQAAAEVGSGPGLETMGRLRERLGDDRQAESWYRKVLERYKDDFPLNSFLVRAQRRSRNANPRPEAEAALRKIFPAGLVHVTPADLTRPQPGEGVRFGPDVTEKLRRLGVKGGDVILALNGFRIHDAGQYSCVSNFNDDPVLTLLVWRDEKVVEVRGTFRRPRVGPPHAPA